MSDEEGTDLGSHHITKLRGHFTWFGERTELRRHIAIVKENYTVYLLFLHGPSLDHPSPENFRSGVGHTMIVVRGFTKTPVKSS